MALHHPHKHTDIPISLEVYHQLLCASGRTAFKKEGWEIAAEAIDEWMRRHDPDAIAMPAIKGYQWKSLFLPDGTLLRTVFGGKNYHCAVEADRIEYKGQAVSPSGFVNAVGGIRRNAWRSTWILLPNTSQWQLADSLRTRTRPSRPRKPAGGVERAPAAPPRASSPAAMSANETPLDGENRGNGKNRTLRSVRHGGTEGTTHLMKFGNSYVWLVIAQWPQSPQTGHSRAVSSSKCNTGLTNSIF